MQDGTVNIGACKSRFMAGDIVTKCFPSSSKWYDVLNRVAHMRWPDLLTLFNEGTKMDLPSAKNKDDLVITIKKEDIGKGTDGKRKQEVDYGIQFAGGASAPFFLNQRTFQTN